MAFSAEEGKGFFRDWLTHVAKPLGFSRFLDVGAGAGIYCDIIRTVYHDSDRIERRIPLTVDAVEPFVEYFTRHHLMSKYNAVFMEDVREFAIGLHGDYDLIICGDVLEHMEKQEAIDVVKGLLPRCRFMWIALPLKVEGRHWSSGYVQGPEDYEENPLNKHLHDWEYQEFIEQFKPLFLVPFVITGSALLEGALP